LEGARYGGNAVRKYGNKLRRRIVTPGSREHQLGKRVRERFTPIKSKKKRKHNTTLKPKKLDFEMPLSEADRSKFGEPAGLKVSKERGSGYGPGENATNILYDMQVGYPTKGSEINERPNDIIFVKGVKYCANFAPRLSGDLHSYFVNFAIVSRKDNVSSGSQMDVALFRSRDTNREQNFEDTLEAIDRHCLPINTDKYHVWTHKRFKLRGQGTNLPGSKMLSGYIPINRQIRFTSANQPNSELSVLWWYGKENTFSQPPFAGTQTGDAEPYQPAAFSANIALTLYWDDPVSISMLRHAMSSIRRRPKYKRRSKSRGPYRGYQ